MTVAATIALAVSGPVITAAPAHACVPGADVDVLCANEQAFVDELSAVGIAPSSNARASLGQAWRICGSLASGSPYDVEVQKVYRDNRLNLDQAQTIVAAAVKFLCTY